MQPFTNAFRHPELFTAQADHLLRSAGRTGDVQAAFGAVEQALEQGFEAALHAALQPDGRGGARGAAARAADLPAPAGPPAARLPVAPGLAGVFQAARAAQSPGEAGAPVLAPGGVFQAARAAQPLGEGGGPAGRGLEPWRGPIEEAAARHGVPAWLVASVVRQESGGDARATSRAGAMGLMQLMPGTAAELGVEAPYDPRQNLEGGVRYLAGLIARFEGDLPRAVAAYNAGPGAVARHGGVPPFPETIGYVRRVLGEAPNGAG
ncbi:MAG: lytic transglycosylase domain-containing protein [Candidatus Sericytochromatia bacterium]|nr:lytic transglycosylase domain-containing protein [Candidatus Sericytochromatia bacterium]